MAVPIYIPTNSAQRSPSFYILTNTWTLCLFDDVILTCVQWYLIVVLICIFLIISDVKHLFMYLWPFVSRLWKKSLFSSSAQFFFWSGYFHFFFSYMSFLGMFPMTVTKNCLAMQETCRTWVRSLRWEDPLEEEMTTHSSTLAWKILWTEEPGGLQSMESHRVRHDWATELFRSTSCIIKDPVTAALLRL